MILPRSDGGKTRGEIQDSFNSYPVMIGRRRRHNRSGARRAEGILLPRLTAHAPNPIPQNNARC